MYFLSKRQNGHAQKRQRAVDKQNAGLSGMDEWVDKEGGSTLFRLGASGFHLCCAPPVGLLAPRRGREAERSPDPSQENRELHLGEERRQRASISPKESEGPMLPPGT